MQYNNETLYQMFKLSVSGLIHDLSLSPLVNRLINGRLLDA